MRKIYVSAISLIFFSFVIAGMVSCKKGGFLAPTSVTDLTQQTVFVDSANTNEFLADIYKNIIVSVYASRFGNGGLDAAGDESQPGNTNASIATYWAAGTINAAVAGDDVYKTCYTEIRAVNQLLKNIYRTKLVLPDNQPGSRAQLKAEARFLRAWYYGILLQHYGGVPLIGDTVYNNYTVPIVVKRNTFEDCVNYIASECDSAKKVLPYTQSGTSYGRADGGACDALKARILLMAASPLFNDNNSIPGPTPMSIATSDAVKALVGYPSYSLDRWKAAEDAADVILSSGAYNLSLDNTQPTRPGIGFQNLFSSRITTPNENILQWMLPNNDWPHELENIWDPPSRSGSSIGGFPYQEMVDAFPMRDGKNVDDPTSIYTYDPQNPYANRDPRLDFTVNHDQSRLLVRNPGGGTTYAPLDIALTNVNGSLTGGVDAVGIGTITGYYTNKMLDTAATSTSLFQPTNRCQPLMRFAEVMLDFAEAKNEYDGGPGASNGASDSHTVYNMLKLLRQRAGILPGADGLYGLKDNMTQTEMRAAIQHERQIELAYEGFRFWDVRRWKIAPAEESKQFHGMKIIKDNGNTTYNIFAVLPKHSFTTRMYLWPFPQLEIGKSTTLLQNPGY